MWEEYLSPRSLQEALEILEFYEGQARVIAGGTDLVPELNEQTGKTRCLIDILGIELLKKIEQDGDTIKIGAGVIHSDVASSELIQKRAMVLSEASSQVGSPQIRNRGTLGGNIGNASPAADAALALIALDAEARVVSNGSQRTVKVADLFVGPNRTTLTQKELITEFRFPALATNQGSAFVKLAQRKALAISVVNAAVVITVDKDRKLFQDAKICVGAVAPIPMRAKKAEKKLIGESISEETINEASLEASREVSPIDDIRGCADYRCQMTRVLVGRAIEAAVTRIR